MYSIPGEDEHWERVREELESRYLEPEPRSELISLDDELDDLEKEYGCSIRELGEPDLEDIVFRIKGIYPIEASYDENFLAIFYKVA